MPLALQAGLWGLLGGSALLLGAAIAYFATLPQRLVATVMALGSGVLISAVAFDLMEEAAVAGGFAATASGFIGGATIFTAANLWLSSRGARHRKRSGHHETERQPEGDEGGLAIALGALLDGIPESVVIGASLLGGGGVAVTTVAAVFLSNVPEGLSSASGMRRAGRRPLYVFGVWGGIALASGVAALLGNAALADAGPGTIAFIQALAAGAILAMIADTMIPEAFAATRDFAGLVTAAGFLLAFWLSGIGAG